MKQQNEEIERYRIRKGRYGSDRSQGNNGAFKIRLKTGFFHVIASDGGGWEHVSITPINKKRCPTWPEMCQIKAIFWGEDETVIQYHPAKEDYVNNHPHCLHLWRPTETAVPKPPPEYVGLKRNS